MADQSAFTFSAGIRSMLSKTTTTGCTKSFETWVSQSRNWRTEGSDSDMVSATVFSSSLPLYSANMAAKLRYRLKRAAATSQIPTISNTGDIVIQGFHSGGVV